MHFALYIQYPFYNRHASSGKLCSIIKCYTPSGTSQRTPCTIKPISKDRSSRISFVLVRMTSPRPPHPSEGKIIRTLIDLSHSSIFLTFLHSKDVNVFFLLAFLHGFSVVHQEGRGGSFRHPLQKSFVLWRRRRKRQKDPSVTSGRGCGRCLWVFGSPSTGLVLRRRRFRQVVV